MKYRNRFDESQKRNRISTKSPDYKKYLASMLINVNAEILCRLTEVCQQSWKVHNVEIGVCSPSVEKVALVMFHA